MKKVTTNSLLLLFILLSLSACKKNKGEASLNINLQSNFGTEVFYLNKTFQFEDGTDFLISKFRFYVSDITLITSDGETIVQDIAEIDFDNNHSTEATASKGESIILEDIAAGDYTGIKFGIGVAAGLNTTIPGDYTDGEPLSRSGEHWLAWDSYIFAKVEGRIDSLGTGVFDENFFYHTGTDATYRTKTINEPFTLKKDEEYVFQLNMDIEKIFTGLDVVQNNMNHNPQDIDFLGKVSDNIANAISF